MEGIQRGVLLAAWQVGRAIKVGGERELKMPTKPVHWDFRTLDQKGSSRPSLPFHSHTHMPTAIES
jgi:hypothetical protein